MRCLRFRMRCVPAEFPLWGIDVYKRQADGYPSAFNDKELMDLAADAVRKELGEDAVVPMPDPMPFSEDFSFYGKLGGIPSAYLMLYACLLYTSRCV